MEMERARCSKVMSAAAMLLLAGFNPAFAATKCVKGDRKPPYTVAWANIYLGPTWMTQTLNLMKEAADTLKKEGLVKDFTVTNANGNASEQIQQIQSMIDGNVDLIVVDAGSATALDRVIEQACAKGAAVVNFDSLVDTDQLATKINTNQEEWGRLSAAWLVKELDGKGKILVLNGPAGVSVSEARWNGAWPVIEAAKGIEVLAIATEYNVAPAQEAVTNLLFAFPKVDGIWSQGVALSAGAVLALERAGRNLVPMTGENYREFLEMWHDKGGEPNWLGAMAIYAGVDALQGKPVAGYIDVPLPEITNANLGECIQRGKDFPDDGYIYPTYSHDYFESLIAKANK
jgi:ribose transport system substrate-binding protein